jgi:hypothetical protein
MIRVYFQNDESAGAFKLVAGGWRVKIYGDYPDDSIHQFREQFGEKLYSLIGMALHGSQQGASELTFQKRLLTATNMEQTSGCIARGDYLLIYNGLNTRLKYLSEDTSLIWPTNVEGKYD